MLDTLLLALLQARADDDREAVADLKALADDPDTVSAMVADDEGDEPVAKAFRKAAEHAPPGGVEVQGTHYPGGQFIPAEVMERATEEEKKRVADGQQGGGVKPSDESDNTPSYEVKPQDIGPLFHGGKKRITAIDPGKLQARDHGYYGAGFYVTNNRRFAENYGKQVTAFQIKPDAKILVSDLNIEDSPQDLVRDVKKWLYDSAIQRAKARGREATLMEDLEAELSSPIGWARAVDKFAEAKGYDIVRHSDGEIVVKNIDAVTIAKK